MCTVLTFTQNPDRTSYTVSNVVLIKLFYCTYMYYYEYKKYVKYVIILFVNYFHDNRYCGQEWVMLVLCDF